MADAKPGSDQGHIAFRDRPSAPLRILLGVRTLMGCPMVLNSQSTTALVRGHSVGWRLQKSGFPSHQGWILHSLRNEMGRLNLERDLTLNMGVSIVSSSLSIGWRGNHDGHICWLLSQCVLHAILVTFLDLSCIPERCWWLLAVVG